MTDFFIKVSEKALWWHVRGASNVDYKRKGRLLVRGII